MWNSFWRKRKFRRGCDEACAETRATELRVYFYGESVQTQFWIFCSPFSLVTRSMCFTCESPAAVGPATSMRRPSCQKIITLFSDWNAHRWQGGSGSRFHTNSLARAVHDWIRCPCGRSVTILLSGSPCGGAVAGPSSLQD